MKQYLKILKKCSLFRGIKEEDLPALLGCLGAKVEHFDKKYTILAEGTVATWIGILLSGAAQITRVDYDGNRSIVAGIEPSELFGEAFACADISSLPVSIIAGEPCEVMLISCQRILYSCSNACGFHQKMIFNLMKDLATKNMMFHQKLEILSQRSTREKLMTYLALRAKEANSNHFTVPFNRQELADYLEVDRSGLSAEISKLRREGVLESERNEFRLL